MTLVDAAGPLLDQILDGTYPVWGESLTREHYGKWNRGQLLTPWGRQHLRRVALVDNGHLLASAKRYDFDVLLAGRVVSALGIGAVFTPETMRGRGHAAALLDHMHRDAEARGCALSLLFSEIGAPYYERLGYRVVPQRTLSLSVTRRAGAPATLVRSGHAHDLPEMADISRRYSEEGSFALQRSADLIGFGLARRRLLAGLGTAGLRELEFFVSEEGHRVASYVILGRYPTGLVLEDCGDRDPTGARVGAMLQVLAARTPAAPDTPIRARLPSSLRPPQLTVVSDVEATAEVMMVRPLGAAEVPADLTPAIYWPLDIF